MTIDDAEIVYRPSPNFNDRPTGAAVDMVVLHYTGMPSAIAALNACRIRRRRSALTT